MTAPSDKPHNLQAINVVPADDDLVEAKYLEAARNIELARNRGCSEYLAGWEHLVVREAASELARCRNALEEARFLCARLREFSWTVDAENVEDVYRDFHGHVAPSIARLELLIGVDAALNPIGERDE